MVQRFQTMSHFNKIFDNIHISIKHFPIFPCDFSEILVTAVPRHLSGFLLGRKTDHKNGDHTNDGGE